MGRVENPRIRLSYAETWDPLAASQQAPEGAVVLLVSEFGHEPDTSRAQQQYFRSSRFKLSQDLQTEIRETLERSGLLAKLLPQVDAETNTPLADAPITEISCTIEWHGRDNFYGDGSTLTISLSLSPAERDPELLLLTVNKRGDIARRLWCEQFMETGYEGHAHMLMHLSETELQTILPTVARVAELTPARQQPFRMGAWLGNSLPQGQ
jgi:hypothetical protein